MNAGPLGGHLTIQDLGSVGEFVAAVATVATLIFLAIQIRQNTKSVRTAAEIDLPQRLADWHARISAQPDLGRIWDLAATDFEALDPDEVRRFRWIVAELFLVFESQYYAYCQGYVSENSWVARRDVMLGLLSNANILEWWSNRLTPIGEEFRAEIDSHLGRDDVSWTHQSVAPRPKPVA
jgi:hypothetical protein